MLTKIVRDTLTALTPTPRELREKYYRYRYAMRKLSAHFPYLAEVAKWVENLEDFDEDALEKRCLEMVQKPEHGLDAYDLLVINNFFREHLVANEIITAKSRRTLVYFDREAADIFFGRKRETMSLCLYVTDKEFLEPLRTVVKSYNARLIRRHSGNVKISVHYISTLDGFTVYKADLFNNIPCIIAAS